MVSPRLCNRRVPRLATADDAISRADLIRLSVDQARSHYGVDEFQHVVSIEDAPWDLRTEVGSIGV